MNPANLPQLPPAILFIIYVWALFWKGLALWNAAQNKQRNWFLAILILSTLGILEIVFLFWFSRKRLKLSELKSFLKLG